MDFSLTPEQADLVARAREASREFPARARTYDAAAAFPRENFDDLHRAGLLALTVPEEYGGSGLWQPGRFLAYYLVIEQIARRCSSTAQLLQVHSHAVGMIAGMGSPAQKARYLPEVVKAGALFASCGSEASVRQTGPEGFDAVLRPSGNGFTLSGSKGFASLAGASDYYVIWALAEGTRRMADGLVMVVVPKGAPGLRLENDWDTLGMRPTVSWSLHLDAVPVEKEQVIGQPGDWVQKDTRTFTLAFAANHLGTAQGVHDLVLEFVRVREDLKSNPVVQCQLAEADTLLASSQALVHYAAWLWEQGRNDEAELASMRALHQTKQTALTVTSRAFDICGARATFRSFPAPLELAYRDVRTFTLHFREDRVLQMLAQAILGAPFHSKQKYGPKLEPIAMHA